MFVYVTAGPSAPIPFDVCKFFSRTNVDRLWLACAIFGGLELAPVVVGVIAPSEAEPPGRGVDAPVLVCVARTEASFR